MLDWLKEILGEAYTEDIDTKVSERIAADYAPKSDLLAAQAAQQTAAEALQAAEQAAEQARFDARLDVAIAKAHGRDARAVRAMLDLNALRTGTDQDAAIAAALAALKKESGYLFENGQTPPPMAAGAGSNPMLTRNPDSSALRAAFGLTGTAGKH